MRKKFVAGNWKMFTDRAGAKKLAEAVVAGLAGDNRVEVALCPPFTNLETVAAVLRGTPVALGAQNCHFENEGAFTGEISPLMLLDLGCSHVILGHSERRHKMGEGDALINKKVHAALAAGLKVILCLGETLEDRQGNQTGLVLKKQLEGSLAGLDEAKLERMVLAYEPVWAIGTGHNATPQQAQEAHAFLRGWIAQTHGKPAADALRIQYGGSVKADNAESLLKQPDVDGGLIGGASLKADQFLPIVRAGI
ncbi:MAG: triose-phosphate isomerase [Gemmataceae bacterium]|nr:triose-phosphate isomerase [Gemmataceae bacterium]